MRRPPAELLDTEPDYASRKQRPRRMPLLWIVSVSALVVGLVGAIAWLLATTVPIAVHERTVETLTDVQNGLVDASSQLADLSVENTDLRADLELQARDNAELEEKNADISEESQHVQQGLRSVTDGVKALAVNLLWYDPEHVSELRAAGLDETIADQLLADLGVDQAFGDWIEGDAWLDINRLTVGVSDERVEQAWDAFLRSEIDSKEEEAAYVELDWRIIQYLIQLLTALESPATSA